MGKLLTATEIKKGLLDPNTKSDWLPLFEKHEFEKLTPAKGFAIVPIGTKALGPMSVDLTVGNEVYSLRRNEKINLSPESRSITVAPGETILVLTKEFLAFSPSIAGITLSRARFMNEGIALSSAKIDPTWYGCLTIPITNNSRDGFTLCLGDRFCTLLLFELDHPLSREYYLTLDNTPHIGQQTLLYQPRHTSAWHPKQADTVRDKDMSDVVLAFGPPYDIIQGMFAWVRTEFKEHIDQKLTPGIMREVKQWILAEVYQQMEKYRETEIRLLTKQIELMEKSQTSQRIQSITMLATIVGWLAIVIGLLWKIAVEK